MRKLLTLLLCVLSCCCFADTIGNYMNIAENIPRMEMKADAKAQAWARSARNIIVITDESIAQTITAINEMATQQGRPLFCMKQPLNATSLDGIIRETYQQLSSQKEVTKLTISQVALIGLQKKYPCHISQREKQLQRMVKFAGAQVSG